MIRRWLVAFLAVVALSVNVGCGSMVLRHPQTGERVKCNSGAGWQAQESYELCVKAALASGYVMAGEVAK